MKYTKKPEVVEAFTFDQFIEYGRQKEPGGLHDNIPWSFNFKGVPVTHENDECYLISGIDDMLSFTPDHILTVDYLNRMTLYLKENFKNLFLPFEK